MYTFNIYFYNNENIVHFDQVTAKCQSDAIKKSVYYLEDDFDRIVCDDISRMNRYD